VTKNETKGSPGSPPPNLQSKWGGGGGLSPDAQSNPGAHG
jgi:hypothetical protein